MIINGESLLLMAPIREMKTTKIRKHGTSIGLSEAGYDISVQQFVRFEPPQLDAPIQLMKKLWSHGLDYEATQEDLEMLHGYTETYDPLHNVSVRKIGRTALLSSMEYFDIPHDLYGEFKNKSTHARKWADFSICTDAEPGWQGHLTIEAVFHANDPVNILSGSGILKVVFSELKHSADYGESPHSKYQHQPNMPVASKVTA